MIHQGDQYGIAINIKSNEEGLTPSDIDGVRIKIGKYIQEYPGDLEYNEDTGKWIFYLTQEQTSAIVGKQKVQVQIQKNGNIIGSNICDIEIQPSILKDEWTLEE